MTDSRAETTPRLRDLEVRARAAMAGAQDAVGQAQDFLEDAVQDRPLATLAMVAVIAFSIGHALGRR